MRKKSICRIALALSMAFIMVLTSASMAFACTSMYFGKATTENGSTFIGRSEDSSWSFYKKCYTVHPAATHEEGEMYKSVSTDFTMPYPATTYRYTLVKDQASYLTFEDEEMAQAGTNEMGVAVSSSVSLSGGKVEIVGNPRQGITGIDGMVDEGLCEEDIPSVVLMQAATAKQGAKLLVNIYETIGAGGRDMTVIMDDSEAWVVQSLSGHVAIAVKCPDNMVGTTPNITVNVPIGNKKDTIMSSNLISIAEEAGTLVKDEDGKILVADSYAQAPRQNYYRLYNCYYYLKGKTYAENNFNDGYIDYFHEPRAKKYSTFEVLQSLAYRGEGGPHYADSTTGNAVGIGNDNNLEVHMFESREGMPTELAVLQWESLGPVEFGCYLPGYNALITDTIEENKIGLDTMEYNYEDPTKNNFRCAYFELYFLCKGRDAQDGLEVGSGAARQKYGKNVRAFWEAYQKELIAQQPVIDADMERILAYDKTLAEQKATELNMHLQKEMLGYIDLMVKELKEFESTPQSGDFVPSCMGALPTYSFEAIGGTGLPVDIAAAEVTLDKTSFNYNGKAQKPAVTVKGEGRELVEGTDYELAYANNTKVGTATVTVKALGANTGEQTAEFTIKALANPMKASGKTVKAKAKKKTVIKASKAFSVKGAKGKVTYTKVKGDKKISIASNGKVTVKKGLKKGKTYKVSVKVKAAGGNGYKAKTQTVTLKVKITK